MCDYIMVMNSYMCTPFSSVSLEEWAFSSNNNIQAAESQRQASSTLRGQIDAVLQQTQQEIDNQRTLVNLEFSKRISEISTTKARLEEHLVKVRVCNMNTLY